MEPLPPPSGAGARARFATLVEPHLPALRAFVERRDPGLADDVLSELGVVAWRRLDELPAGHERAWLFGVARTVLLAERRKAAARHRAEVGDPAIVAELPAPAAEPMLSRAVAAPLAQALSSLSGRDRELLLLTAWEGLSTAEAARAVGIRATAARMGLVRARRRLAAALDDLDPGWRAEHLAPPADPGLGSGAADASPGPPPAPSASRDDLHPSTPSEVPACADAT